uniref:Cubilin-like isoform X1 n=1 Tax=Crassostrea virginica TaxID=6565 RepID=A0A8B8AY23_CRAVI|nr:cubilin-like isoform X1 [Crassostrea virginica]
MLVLLLLVSIFSNLINADCDGNLLMAGNGVIQNEGYPTNYSHNLNCSWTIQAPASEQVVLTFNKIMTEDCERCSCDYVQVRDGPNVTSPILATYCGDYPQPFSVMSSGDALTVRFVTDATNEGEGLIGFSANYTSIPECGGNFTAMNGTIMSPAVNDMYPNYADCLYQITVPPTYRVFLKVERLILQDKNKNNTCSDFLEVNEAGMTLGKYCGEQDRFSLMTSQNTVLVRFFSDGMNTSQGFTLLWEAMDCTQEYTEATGMISSPGFGGLYPSNANCTYNITLPPSKNVFLKFSLFELEAAPANDSAAMANGYCADILKKYDSSGLLESYCGLRDPFSIISTNNTMFLRFETNLAINLRGFKADYETIDSYMMYTDYTGTITPPLFRGMYAHNANITYSITRPQNEPIFLTFPNFELQEAVNGTCLDFIQVGIDTKCGEQDPMMYMFYGEANFRFRSDLAISAAGFQAQYDVCNTTLTEETGVLRSPGYPSAVYENITCTYTFKQTNQRQISLDFTDFSLPPKVNGTCETYVKITDRYTGDIEVMTYDAGQMMPETMLCGNKSPFNVTVPFREITITYKSSAALNNTMGFKMNFNVSEIPTTNMISTTTRQSTTTRVSTTTIATTQAPVTTTTGAGAMPEPSLNANSITIPIVISIVVISVVIFIVAVIWIIKTRNSRGETGSLDLLSMRRTRQSYAAYNPAYEPNIELNTADY